MNGQNFETRFNSSVIVNETDMRTNLPEANSDPFVDKIPVDAGLIHETPMMDETIVHEAPMGETIPYKAPVPEPTVEGSWTSKSFPYKTPVSETVTHEVPIETSAGSLVALLNREESEHFRTRWNEIQGKFVDEPRAAVQQADGLVSEVIEKITQMFTSEHSMLEGEWKQGNDVSTEDLRKALKRYRSFFNRLVL
jgi:hypothetical protein